MQQEFTIDDYNDRKTALSRKLGKLLLDEWVGDDHLSIYAIGNIIKNKLNNLKYLIADLGNDAIFHGGHFNTECQNFYFLQEPEEEIDFFGAIADINMEMLSSEERAAAIDNFNL